MAKILYLSCHSILEYDEVKLLHELGHEIFSPGAYVEPANPGDASLRPEIPGLVYDKDLLERFHKIAGQHPGEDTKDHLTKDFVDQFDMVIVMHMPRWIERNWEVMKHKRVIWRTIGQSVASTEYNLRKYRNQGMEVVRYSPMEVTIPEYLGEDALIRFYKDPAEYGGWSGKRKRVISFAQSMKERDAACNFSFFEEVTRPFSRHLFGPGNEDIGAWTSGKVPYEDLKKEMRENRVYFYTGTHPASYTLNFIEAWMTGIPIVAIGDQHGNAPYFMNHLLYEVSSLISNCVDGFVSDDIDTLREYIEVLMHSDSVADNISKRARTAAIRIFGKDVIAEQWRSYLG
jgi:hypothetical protein